MKENEEDYLQKHKEVVIPLLDMLRAYRGTGDEWEPTIEELQAEWAKVHGAILRLGPPFSQFDEVAWISCHYRLQRIEMYLARLAKKLG